MSILICRELCFIRLYRLYRESDKCAGVAVSLWEGLAAGASTCGDEQNAIAWLSEQRLIRLETRVGWASLTALGLAALDRAVQSPESDSVYFPALVEFFNLDDPLGAGVCQNAVDVLLGQLDDCVDVLLEDKESSALDVGLEYCLSELEQCVFKSSLEVRSLRLGLIELRSKL